MFHFTADASCRGVVLENDAVTYHRRTVGRIAPAGVPARLHTIPGAWQRITPCFQPIAQPFHFPGNAQKRPLTVLDAYEPRRVTELAVRDIDGLSAALRLLAAGTPPTVPSSPICLSLRRIKPPSPTSNPTFSLLYLLTIVTL
ncbi:hypothetical protein DPSP01_002568 [Paraphaeosphaeria sporulosa]